MAGVATNRPNPISGNTENFGENRRLPESSLSVAAEGGGGSEDIGIRVETPIGTQQQGGGLPTQAEVTQDDRTRARLVYVNAFYLRLADMALTVGLLIWQQLGFSSSWSDSCDYEVKIWATVWLGAALARSTLITCVHGANLCLQRPVPRAWSYAQALLELFAFAWFLYGIQPLFAGRQDRFCNKVSEVWALLGWTLQALTFFCPCILFITCVPCLLCLTRFEWVRRRILPLLVGPVEPSTNQMPTPDEILRRLKPTTFGEAVSRGEIDLEQPEPPVPPQQPSPDAVGEDQSGIGRAGFFNSTLGVGGFGQAMTSLMQRLNSSRDVGAEGAVTSQESVSQVRPPAPAAGQAQQPPGILTCPICVTEFQPEDQILQLPCEPRKHVFHLSCVQEWLGKSQHCPMCRTNMVEWFRDHGEPEGEGGRETVPAAATGDAEHRPNEDVALDAPTGTAANRSQCSVAINVNPEMASPERNQV